MSNAQIGYRVGIDGFNLAIPRGTGIATYARSLSICVTQMGHPVDVLYGLHIDSGASPVMRQVAFFEQLHTSSVYRRPRYPSLGWAKTMLAARSGIDAVEVPIDNLVERRPFKDRLPEFDRIMNADSLFDRASQYFQNFGKFLTVRIKNPPAIMHWTYPVPVILEDCYNVYTIHDMVPLKMPYATLDNKPTHARIIAGCIKLGDHICTVSERSKEDILDFFPELSRDRISNSYQAVQNSSPTLSPDHSDRILRDQFGLVPQNYFLFFGSIEPKKNISRLVLAYLASEVDLPLVIVTARGWQANDEALLLKEHVRPDSKIKQIEYVSSDLLALLIQGARAVTFPSVYEGFGLPVLEAMLLGTPVLTTREGSLPEIAGDAALFVDAYDVTSISQGIHRLATDDDLCDELAQKGLAQADKFSMANYKERIADIYSTVLSRPKNPWLDCRPLPRAHPETGPSGTRIFQVL